MLKEVALNIVAQIMFFIVNITVIPYFINEMVIKEGDIAKLKDEFTMESGKQVLLQNELDEFNKMSDEERKNQKDRLDSIKSNYRKIVKKTRYLDFKFSFVSKIYETLSVFNSWTIGLISDLILYFILLITFNKPEIKFSIDKYELVTDVSWTESHWLNFVRQIGVYLACTVRILFASLCKISVLYLLLPNTFISILEEINDLFWLCCTNFSSLLVIDVLEFIKNILWNKLILVGLNESIVGIVIVFIAMFLFNSWSSFEENSTYPWAPVIVASIVIANLALFALTPLYIEISRHINFIGMIIFIALILDGVINLITFSSNKVLPWLLDKINPLKLFAKQ